MPCTRKPYVTLRHQALFIPHILWNDANKCIGGANRQIQWRFYQNGTLVHSTAFASPSSSLAIGTNSTYVSLNATAQEISDYLVANSIDIESGDQIHIEVRAKSCKGFYDDSDRVLVIADVTNSTCPCNYVVANATGQTGNTATPPGGFTATAGLLAFRNGLLNYAGNDYSADPLVSSDNLMSVTLGGCTATLDQVTVTNQTGTVTIPSAFAALPPKNYLVYRNSQALYNYSTSSGQLTPGDGPSVSTDQWHFVRITNTTDGCHFGAILIGANVTGSTFNLPAGYSATNAGKWLLVRGGLTMQTTAANATDGYSVAGGTVTLATAAAGETFWIQPII